MDVAAFDAADRLDPAQGCLGRSQGAKALTVAKEAFHGRMIALDQIIAPLSVDIVDAVKIWVIAVVDFADHSSIAMRLVGYNSYWPIKRTRSIALLRNAFAAFASRCAVRRKSTICPFASTVRHR